MTALYLTLAAINGSFIAASFPPTSVTHSSYEYPNSLALPHYSFLPQTFASITYTLVFPLDSPPIPFMASHHGSAPAPHHSCDRNNERWDNPNMQPRTRSGTSARRATLNYVVSSNPKTQDRIHNLELQAQNIRRRVTTEEVDTHFEWIPDPSLTRARENLYSHTIELSW